MVVMMMMIDAGTGRTTQTERTNKIPWTRRGRGGRREEYTTTTCEHTSSMLLRKKVPAGRMDTVVMAKVACLRARCAHTGTRTGSGGHLAGCETNEAKCLWYYVLVCRMGPRELVHITYTCTLPVVLMDGRMTGAKGDDGQTQHDAEADARRVRLCVRGRRGKQTSRQQQQDFHVPRDDGWYILSIVDERV